MTWNRDAFAADLIVKDAPKEWLMTLLPLDGTTAENPSPSSKAPHSMIALGLACGAAGGSLVGGDVDWLTPLGQAVVDRIKKDGLSPWMVPIEETEAAPQSIEPVA
jgi:hypothetical protein